VIDVGSLKAVNTSKLALPLGCCGYTLKRLKCLCAALQVERVQLQLWPTKLALDQVSFGISPAAERAFAGPQWRWCLKAPLMALFSRLYRLQHGDNPVGGVSLRRQTPGGVAAARVVFPAKHAGPGPERTSKNLALHAAPALFEPPWQRRFKLETGTGPASLVEHPAPARARAEMEGTQAGGNRPAALLHQPGHPAARRTPALAWMQPAVMRSNQHISNFVRRAGAYRGLATHLMDELILLTR